jgi:hypothetical protein
VLVDHAVDIGHEVDGLVHCDDHSAVVELIFGCEDAAEALLDELKQSPPGLHDPDSDRVFWVEEFADLFVLYADFRRQKSECVLLVDRRVAINPYLEDVAATLDSAAEVRRRRMAS